MDSIYTPYKPERYTIKKYLGKGKYGGHMILSQLKRNMLKKSKSDTTKS